MTSRLWAILCLIMVGSAGSCGASADQTGRGKEQVMADIFIHNATELAQAISSSKGGETYILSPGDYGNVKVHNLNLDSPITIRSQNLSDLAHFDFLDVYLSKNVVISDIDIGSPLAPGEDLSMWTSAVRVRSSGQVTLDNLKISGTDDGIHTNDRVGLYVVDSSDVTLTNSEFVNLHNGGGFVRTSGISVSDNVLHDIRLDGLVFAQVHDVLVKGNLLFDFWKQPGDHSDAIQFWTAGTTVSSSNITIQDNRIFQGNGLGQQGIFIRDDVGKLPFQNVLIENNLIYQSTEYNGMSVDGVHGLIIRSNTVASAANDNFRPFLRVQNSVGGEVHSNVSDFYIDNNNSNVVFHDNVDLSKDTGIISKIPGLQSSTSVDVDGFIIPNAGYQAVPSVPLPGPTVSDASPIGHLLGSMIGNQLTVIADLQSGQVAHKVELDAGISVANVMPEDHHAIDTTVHHAASQGGLFAEWAGGANHLLNMGMISTIGHIQYQ